jgi:hypothetical protein
MPLAVMEVLGMSCTKYYETSEIIYAVDSRKVSTVQINQGLLCLDYNTPHIITVFNIIRLVHIVKILTFYL